MPASSTMNYADWDMEVRKYIADDWLELIEGSDQLSDQLDNILKSLHFKYQPQEDGSWSASPRWQDMFNWTSCPVDKVCAVILLKRPKTVSSGWTSDWESDGQGGVKRRSGINHGQRISEIGTVWSMLEVARQCLQYPDADLKALVETKYHNGFNPKYLSQRGILFLNVALTTGHTDHLAKENSDMSLWQTFTLGLLDAIQGTNIPLFQWYITNVIKSKLSNWKSNGKFMVSKPKILDLGDGSHKHICHFWKYEITGYAMELAAEEYRKHKAILREIYMSIVCESKVQTYPVAMEPLRGTKRRADLRTQEHQEDVPASRIKLI